MNVMESSREISSQLSQCGHCQRNPAVEIAQLQPLYRVRCLCGIQTAWGTPAEVLAVWNYRPCPAESDLLRSLRRGLEKMHCLLSGLVADPETEPLPPARQLTTTLMPDLAIIHEEPGNYRVRSGDRWERCTADEALWVVSSWLHGKFSGYLRTDAQHAEWENWLARPRTETEE